MDDYNYNFSPGHISNHRRSMIYVLIGTFQTLLRDGHSNDSSCHGLDIRCLCSGLYRES